MDTTTIPLVQFLDEWGDVLTNEAIKNMTPIYKPANEDDWDKKARARLSTLKLKALEGQIVHGILPVARWLYQLGANASILVGEMGTGKTYMSLAVAHLSPKRNQRIIIMAPGHLVMKWIREARRVIPGCKCYNANGRSMSLLIEHKEHPRPPVGTEIWVIGRDRAKLHYRKRKSPFQNRIHKEICPSCCNPVEFEENQNEPKCGFCKKPLWCADNKGVRRYAPADFIKRYLPEGYFDLAVVDEIHEYKAGQSAQGQAMACLANVARKCLALTGTLMGGYARDLYYLLWRLFPSLMKRHGFNFSDSTMFSQRYGVMETKFRDSAKGGYISNVESISKNAEKLYVREAPGVSPLILPELLLERTAFVRLVHVNEHLPEYEEFVIPVEMDSDQKEAYRGLERGLANTVAISVAKGSKRLLGKMVQSLLAYPDGCRHEEIVSDKCLDGSLVTIASAPALDINVLPKEQELIDLISSEKAEGRKACVYLEHTGRRNLLPELVTLLVNAGFKPLVLQSTTVSPEKREAWLEQKMATGEYDVLLSNPNLVKTGLDLLYFPTIVFFQTGYSVYTLRQASRRSWRIGQNEPVRVFFFVYSETMQERALSLMATKMECSLAIEGVLSDKGLAAMSESENNIMYELAMTLVGHNVVDSIQQSWESYQKRERALSVALDMDETPQSTAGGSKIRYIYRGEIYMRKSGPAIAVIDRHKFMLQAGVIYWNSKEVGYYLPNGEGVINSKPIRIYKPEGRNNYVLAEVQNLAA